MALVKKTTVDEITVTSAGVVLVKEMVQIIEDGDVVSSTVRRNSIAPGSRIDDQPAQVQAICSAVWTQEVLENYRAAALLSDAPVAPRERLSTAKAANPADGGVG